MVNHSLKAEDIRRNYMEITTPGCGVGPAYPQQYFRELKDTP